MANFIQPDPALLPIPPTTTPPVVTTTGGMPLEVVSQPLVTTVPVSLPIVSTAMAVMATITPATITLVVITTTAATLMASTAPMAVIPQEDAVSSTQQFMPPYSGGDRGHHSGDDQWSINPISVIHGWDFLCYSGSARSLSPCHTKSPNVGNFHHPFRAYPPSESPHHYSTLQPEASFRGVDGS